MGYYSSYYQIVLGRKIKDNQKRTDASAFVSVVEPYPVDVCMGRPVEQERVLQLKLQLACDWLDEVTGAEPIDDHEAVQRSRGAGVDEQGAPDLGALPLVALSVVRVYGHLSRRKDNV